MEVFAPAAAIAFVKRASASVNTCCGVSSGLLDRHRQNPSPSRTSDTGVRGRLRDEILATRDLCVGPLLELFEHVVRREPRGGEWGVRGSELRL